MKVKVLRIFRDKFTKEIYTAGKELQFGDESKDRVQDLVTRRLVEVVADAKKEPDNNGVSVSLFDREFEKKTVVEAMRAIGGQVTMNMKEETLIGKVAALDEDKTIALKEALGIEVVKDENPTPVDESDTGF
ncbi:MAG: hypothetical protein LBV32_03200 [Tannerellaceae bacterium]|jgi:hypothetical protein|nr:hypothetical protein [Tannerellaceae bacterium]